MINTRHITYKYYSQHGEDYLLFSFFDYKKTGFYIDVGAFDGVHLSNTFFFEQQGWSGICIEPHPEFFPKLQASRPQSRCVNAACIGDETLSTVDFYLEELGLLSGIQGGEKRENDVRKRYKRRRLNFQGFTKMPIKAATLNGICESYLSTNTPIDFVSIDVEGTELDVLKGFDLGRYQPPVLVIESHSASSRRELTRYLAKQKYYKAKTVKKNIFYVRNEPDVQRFNEMKIDCLLAKNIHPLGEKFTLVPFLDDHIILESEYSDILEVIRNIRSNTHDSARIHVLLDKISLYLLQHEQVKSKKEQLKRKDEIIARKTEQLKHKDEIIARKTEQVKRKDEIIARKTERLQRKNKVKTEQLKHKDEMIMRKNERLKCKDEIIAQKNEQLRCTHEKLKRTHEKLKLKNEQLKQKKQELRQIAMDIFATLKT